MTKRGIYQVALAVSLIANVVLAGGIALYLHFEGLLSIVTAAVAFFD